MNTIEKSREAQLFGDVIATSIPKMRSPANTSVAPEKSPNAGAIAAAFLIQLDPTGWHNLVALDPALDRSPPADARTFRPGSGAEIAQWVDHHNGRYNCYFSANEPQPKAPNKKLAAGEIGAIRIIYADVDPKPGVPLDEARRALFGQADSLESLAAPPTFTIDTGGGVQIIWKLAEKYDVKQFQSWAEGEGRAVADMLSGDRVQNIDRLLRLPGTINIPTPSKAKKGRVRRVASVVAAKPDRTYTSMQLSSAIPPVAPQPATGNDLHLAAAFEAIDMSIVESNASFEELPSDLRTRFTEACREYATLDALWKGDRTALLGRDETSSAWRASLAAQLSQLEGFDVLDYAQLAFVWPHLADHQDKMDHRQLARDWARFGAPNVAKRQALLADYFVQQEIAAETAVSAWIDPTAWLGQTIKLREWEVEGWIPRHEVTLLYGDGGIGKTLLAHQYATAAATGRSWLGQNTRPARVMCFFCEDSAAELHRRQADINALLHVDYPDLGNLRLASRKHDDNALGIWDRSAGGLKLTDAWHRLKADAAEFSADVIVIDTLSDVFVGDEISRTQVNAFVKGCLGRLGAAIGGTVIALGHPSVAGKASGSGTSGSTAWNNAVRSRLYLRYPKGTDKGNIRELEGMKLNYGPKGSLLKIRWERGAFATIAGNTTAAANAVTGWPADLIPQLDDVAEAATIKALNECSDVALSMSKNSAHFAPKVLGRRSPELLQGYSVDEIQGAMERLERKKLIRSAVVGRTSSRHPINGFAVVIPDNLSGAANTKASVFE